MIAYYAGLAAEFLIWIVGLIWLFRKKGYAGIVQNFVLIAVLPLVVLAVDVFSGKFPVYAGGPLPVAPPLGAFEYGVLHGFVLTAILNFAIALIAVAKAARLRTK